MAVRCSISPAGLCLILATAMMGAACTRPATQLVVVVSSDLAVPGQLTTVRARVRPIDTPIGPDGARTFPVDGPAGVGLPFSFGIVPPEGDASRRVEVVVEALDPTGAPVVSRVVRTGFLPGQALRLPIFLASSCRDRICDAELTCDGGVCVPPDVAPETLDPVRPGDELRDAGASDGARTDAGTDTCTPVATRPWLPLPGVLDGADLVFRDGPRREWLVAIGGSFGLRVHAVAEDGTGDREVAAASGSSWQTGPLALVPLPSPDEVLVIRRAMPVVEVRGTLITEGGGRADRLLASSLSFLDVASLGGGPVMLSDETPSPPVRPAGLYAIPVTGPAVRIGPVDLGTTMYAYRGSLASRRDGSLLVGRAATGACEVMPVSSTGVSGSFASFPVPRGSCLRPAMAELTDGRIGLVSGSSELFVVMIVSADLTAVEAMRDLGTLPRADAAVVALPDGSLRIFWPSAEGISTLLLAADGALTEGETTIAVASPGALWSGIAHQGRATAITHVEVDRLILTVLCD